MEKMIFITIDSRGRILRIAAQHGMEVKELKKDFDLKALVKEALKKLGQE